MNKRIVNVLLIVSLVALVATACGGKDDFAMNPKEVADELVAKIDFKDEVIEVDLGKAAALYESELIEDGKLFVSSGASAEELAVFAVSDINKAKEEFSKRVERQKEDFESYNPAELKKLDETIIKSKGKYIILCVTDDKDAETKIEEYLK